MRIRSWGYRRKFCPARSTTINPSSASKNSGSTLRPSSLPPSFRYCRNSTGMPARLGSRSETIPRSRPDGFKAVTPVCAYIEADAHERPRPIFLKGKVLSRNATMSCLETLAYDLRYASAQDLLEGRGFQIVEVNGVSSEATSIYDPKNSLRSA